MEVIAGNRDGIRLVNTFAPTLEFPDGTTELVHMAQAGSCTVAFSYRAAPLYVFLDGHFSYQVNKVTWEAIVTNSGYIVSTNGKNPDILLSIMNLKGMPLFEREMGSLCRGLALAPGERYAATWRLSDRTIFVFDLVEKEVCGSFCTDELKGYKDVDRTVNINVRGWGTTQNPLFELEDNYSDSQGIGATVSHTSGETEIDVGVLGDTSKEILGHITPEGDLLVDSGSI